MPELPEVEVIRRGLLPVEGQTVSGFVLGLPRIYLGPSLVELKKQLLRQSLKQIHRRGKYLGFQFKQGTLIFHLGMTGQLTYIPRGEKKVARFKKTVTGMQVLEQGTTHQVDKHTHFQLSFKGGDAIYFRDVRTFGKILWSEDWANHPRIKKLGPEPLEITQATFLQRWPSKSERKIKQVLLDQSFLAGVGNIYADESLFLTQLHPETKANKIAVELQKKLLKNIKQVLKKGIKNYGTSFSDYVTSDGKKGSNQEKLLVYGRGGMPCMKCETQLIKTVVAQRGTVHCPRCQPVMNR